MLDDRVVWWPFEDAKVFVEAVFCGWHSKRGREDVYGDTARVR